MSNFKVGYAEVNINPPLGAGVSGYYIPRYGKGFLDDLMSEVMVLSLGEKKIGLISVDTCGVDKCIIEKVKDKIRAVKDVFSSYFMVVLIFIPRREL